jgi:hypothetical protein
MNKMLWGAGTTISIFMLSILTMASADTLTIQYNDGATQSVLLDRPSSSIKRLDFAGDRAVSRSVENLARGKQARQSSTGYGGDAGRAVDGNTSGEYFSANSVSHTNNQPQEWWEVDLGAIYNIGLIKIWNRTDCCSEKLSNFYVMVSEKPFSSSNINNSLAQPGMWSNHNSGTAGRTTEIKVNARGRYVRIQLLGTNYLHLAEFEVFGN